MSEHEIEEQQEIYATLVEINQEPTELYKILKFEHIVSGGGEAKQIISDGYVYLNGEVETRKRKKVYSGDLLYVNDQYFQIALKGAVADYEMVDENIAPTVTTQQQPSATKNNPGQVKKARKPISF